MPKCHKLDLLKTLQPLRPRLPRRIRLQYRLAPNTNQSTVSSRVERLIARTPTKFLRTRLSALQNAPVSIITSFLILHEITAIVPLFALFGLFHYTKWLPAFFAEGEWMAAGVERFGRYFERKGWITSEDARHAKDVVKEGEAVAAEKRSGDGVEIKLNVDGRVVETNGEATTKWWSGREGGTRLVIEFATAYAVVKVLLPLRIMVSIWGAPWFARRAIQPVSNSFSRISKYFSKRNAGFPRPAP